MINFFKAWANQIIVATIITTIIEMILPNGNNKKYIKMIIGLYVLFTIIQPMLTKITGDSFYISNFNYEKYFDKDVLETSSENFENNNSKLIKQAYINNIKEDIKTKINQKGYDVINCSIELLDNEDKEYFGIIHSINLSLKNKEIKTEKETANTVKINNVEVEIDNNAKIETSKISDKERIKIIEYLAEEYSVHKTNIIIN